MPPFSWKNIVCNINSKLKFAYNNPPVRIPIKREESTLDLRTKRIVLTDKYIDRMEFLEDLIEKFQNDLTNGISDVELNTFFSVIDKMKENLNK